MGRNDLIVFGDGSQALWYDEKNIEVNKEGVKEKPILIVPDERTKKRYKLTPETELVWETKDGFRAMERKYPKKWIIPLYKGSDGSTTLIVCAFDKSRTDLMDYYGELLELDKQRDKTEKQLRSQVSTLNRQLEDVTSQMKSLLANEKEMTKLHMPPKSETEEEST